MDIVIHKLDVFRISTGVKSSARIWSVRNGEQDVFVADLSENETYSLGPYVNISRFRIEQRGIVSIERVFNNFKKPVSVYTSHVVNKTDSYTVTLGDQNCFIRMGKGTAQTLTIPPENNVDFEIGTEIAFEQSGVGQLTVVAGTGVTIHTSSTLVLTGQYSTAAIKKIGANEWVIAGSLQ